MPVEDHEVHPSTKVGKDYRYGCFNREPYNDAYYAMQRCAGTDGYKPTWWFERVRIPFRMSKQCMTAATGWAATDPFCEGCNRQHPKELK